MIQQVVLSSRAQKDIRKLPNYILDRLMAWMESIEVDGLEETRKVPGYHDEPLKGDRKGQRSVRLNRSYRVIYIIFDGNRVAFVSVEEVNKHEY